MKLLVFSPYYPPHRGGLESHSDEFNKHLAKAGVAITVFTPQLPLDSLTHETLHETVKIIRFPAIELIHNYPFPAFWRKSFWHCWHEIQMLNPDITLSRTRFFFPSLMAGYYAWRKKTPWVHIEHGSDFAQFESPFKDALGRLYDYAVGAFILRQADRLIANSHASKEFVAKLSGRQDCHVIYRGIEKDLILEAPIIPSLDTSSQVHIGYIGRLIEGKGVKDLIVAWSLLKPSGAHLSIIGDGPEEVRLRALIRELHLESSISLLGAKPLPIAMGHLKAWDIFVNPSYTEGIPTAVIEACLLGKYVIATHVGGTREIITGENDGTLVSPHQPQAIADALSWTLSHPKERLEAAKTAEQKVASRFVWDEAAKHYRTLFDEILSS